jgi:hypothetical protein
MLNKLLQPPNFLLAEQYASQLTVLGVAVCWMPVLPISPYIAAVSESHIYCPIDCVSSTISLANAHGCVICASVTV